jgi:transglutaminase-like putative cysteine protease
MLPSSELPPTGRSTDAPPIRESRWIDYILIGAMCALALYSAGQAINQPAAGWVFLGVLAVGTTTSYFLGRLLKGTPFVVLDAWIYIAAALCAVFFEPALNQLLPEEAIPQEIWTCGLLAWMLALGSFGTWRDGPLLFQAVPGLALFGLVGIYDTFPEAPFYFFGYLLCLAVLFGRAHARAMLLQAHQSGFSRIEEGVSLSEENSEQDAMLNAMRRGPWRWMAGPEWALASAAVVIFLSLVGAPIIRFGVKNISGFVPVNLPRQMRFNARPTEASAQSLVRVGGGPRTLTSTIVLYAKLDHPRYLRSTTYGTFDNNNWVADTLGQSPDAVRAERELLLSQLLQPRNYAFDIVMAHPEGNGIQIPLPAEVNNVASGAGAVVSGDGTFSLQHSESVAGDFPGVATESGVEPGSTPETRVSRHTTDAGDATPKVQSLVDEITAGEKTDWDRANAIMREIGRRCKYNLKAAAVPAGANAVESFLFDQKEGYCDLFATAVVVMARAAGMTARYAVGYLPNDERAKDREDYYVVRESDSHAWAEIYFNGVGWVVFDATGLAQDVTPGGLNRKGSFDWRPYLLGAGVVLVLAGVGYAGWQVSKRFSPTPRAILTRRRLGRAYTSFAEALGSRARLRRLPSTTPDGWLATVAPSLGALSEPAAALNDRFVAALYSPGSLSDASLDQLERDVRAFRRLRAPRTSSSPPKPDKT